jgi:hypothetical protein
MHYKELDLNNGIFVPAGLDYRSLMRKRITKHSSYLQPIYEAISNALEVLLGGYEDSITVRLYFEKPLFKNIKSFISVEIKDNATGFNELNTERMRNLFDESKGFNNLGSGRIQFMHFFQTTDINSIYEEGINKYSKRIVLSLNFYEKYKSIMWESKPFSIDNKEVTGTSVAFYLPKSDEDLNNYSKLTTDSLRQEIYLHYLEKLCYSKPKNPIIRIEEYVNNIHINKNDRLITNDDLPESDYDQTFKIKYSKIMKDGDIQYISKSEDFNIKAFKLPLTIQNKNEVKLVSKKEIADVPNIEFPLIKLAPKVDDCYRLFLVSSPYLTSKDVDERGKLNLIRRCDFLKTRNLMNREKEEILIDDIQNNVTTNIASNYSKIKDAKINADAEFEKLITMFSLDKNIVESVVSNKTDSSLNILKTVYQYNAELQAKGDDNLKKVYDSLVDLKPGTPDFKTKLKERINRVTTLIPEINRVELTRYTSKRKVILTLFKDVLEKKLQCQTGRRKNDSSETLFHDIFFSKGTSDALDSNLWMINDDFIHYKGSSDTMLRNIEYGGMKFLREDLSEEEEGRLDAFHRNILGNRPDILLFPAEHKCIIIELKSLSVNVANYISQINRYASIIREFSKSNLEISDFYCYLIGESFTYDEIKRADSRFKKDYSMDFFFQQNIDVYGGPQREDGKMYMEIIKYSTLLDRAINRNKIFTDKISTIKNTDGNGI